MTPPGQSPPRRRRRAAAGALFGLAALAPAAGAQSAAEPPRGAAALAQAADALTATTRVLVVGAHPDDEDTRLIAWLARGRHAETSYLSLTRGDGGQNLIGNELGEALGAVRTEELLAARRLDGGRQYFTRAFDFGFSKSAAETFRHWPRDSVLGDVVRVVRATRPHAVIAIFSGTRADGHGHHEASGLLAREAFDAAGDTARFPAAGFGPAWAPAKFYRNTSYRGAETATLRYDAGRYDPALGRSYAELAAVSRTQHKSQGQGRLEPRGPSVVSMRREAARANAGVAAERERDLFDGVDTTWARFAPAVADRRRRLALDSLPGALAAARGALDVRRPEAMLPLVGRAERLLDEVCGARGGGAGGERGACDDADPLAADLRATRDVTMRRLHRLAQLAAGVEVEARTPRLLMVAGRPAPVTVTVYNRGRRPVRVHTMQLGAPDAPDLLAGAAPVELAPGDSVARAGLVRAPAPTSPWWLARPRPGDVFDVGAGARTPEEWRDVGALDVIADVRADGARAVAEAPVVFREADPVLGDVARPAASVPAVSVTLDRAVQYARAGVALDRTLRVHLRSADTGARTVTVRLALPAGLAADSAVRTVTLAGYDAQATVGFRLRGALAAGRHVVRATAESGGERFAAGYQLVDYPHVRPQRLYRPAEAAVEAVGVALPPRAAVAYVPGVSDNVAPALADLGLPVTVLGADALGAADLSRFTHVVVGPRAYEASPALRAANARLLDWVRAGGTMVVQYGQYEMTAPGVMPYPVTLARPAQRVTIEESPVAALAGARVLAAPNRIGDADWRGWVQERSTYMPRTADPRYRTAVSLADPGEPANPNAVLVAPLGRGTYVYTTLALFRQLPAGVPGAARLVANLLAARAEAAPPNAAGR